LDGKKRTVFVGSGVLERVAECAPVVVGSESDPVNTTDCDTVRVIERLDEVRVGLNVTVPLVTVADIDTVDDHTFDAVAEKLSFTGVILCVAVNDSVALVCSVALDVTVPWFECDSETVRTSYEADNAMEGVAVLLASEVIVRVDVSVSGKDLVSDGT
jgi:hypothetical protein